METAEQAISDADVIAATANQAYIDYLVYSTGRLAEIDILIANATITSTASITAAKTTLNNAITDLNTRQAIVNTNYTNYNTIQRTNFPSMNPVQLMNYIGRTRRNIEGCEAIPPTYLGCSAANTAALQADVDRYQLALDNFNTLNATPLAEANTARQAVIDAQAALDALTSSSVPIAPVPPALTSEINDINNELARLQGLLVAANQAVTDAGVTADAADAARLAIPAYTCPYPPAP